MRKGLLAVALMMAAPNVAQATCGGDFAPWLQGVAAEAVAQGLPRSAVTLALRDVRPDPKVLQADRNQGVFRRDFTDFARRLISNQRLQTGLAKAKQHKAIFARAEAEYGVPAAILLAFWAFETDYGAVQGDYNTMNALATLAHDCRRPELFRPQLLAALRLAAEGQLDPLRTTGAWAGEIGMVQMLPADILARGVDGDADGKVSLKTSVADALLSGAAMLRHHGWRANEPWLQEVVLPSDLDWSLTGLHSFSPVEDWQALGVKPRNGAFPKQIQGAILLPQGRKGPAFMAYPNFNSLFEWNKSFVYVTTAAYFATRLAGAGAFDAGQPDPALSEGEMRDLQQRLGALGHDVGAVDGILGAKTRQAVQLEQKRLGLPADAWPTLELLRAL